MNAHVTEYLSAYYDGELHGLRYHQVEEHLRICSECRSELEGLNKFSNLLISVPLPENQLSAQRFNSQVGLRLPQAIPQAGWQKVFKLGWQITPFLALFTWVFVQAVLIVAGIGSFLYLPLRVSEPDMLTGWLNLASALFNGGVDEIIWLSLYDLAFTSLVAVFLGGWLASWWVVRRNSTGISNLEAV